MRLWRCTRMRWYLYRQCTLQCCISLSRVSERFVAGSPSLWPSAWYPLKRLPPSLLLRKLPPDADSQMDSASAAVSQPRMFSGVDRRRRQRPNETPWVHNENAIASRSGEVHFFSISTDGRNRTGYNHNTASSYSSMDYHTCPCFRVSPLSLAHSRANKGKTNFHSLRVYSLRASESFTPPLQRSRFPSGGCILPKL